MHLVARSVTQLDLPIMLRLCRPLAATDERVRAKATREWNAIWRMNPQGIVLENLDREHGPQAKGMMLTLFAAPEMFDVCMRAEVPDVLHRLVERFEADVETVLTPEEVSAANAIDGVDLLVAYIGWDGVDPFTDSSAAIRGRVVTSYTDRCSGYRLRSMFGEIGGDALLEVALNSDCEILNDYADWASEMPEEALVKRPYLVGVTRHRGLRSKNFWFVRMFTYFEPLFNFTESQRMILILAREGYTDSEIARAIGSTTDAVKKRWSGIYERVHLALPGLLPESQSGGRGHEKRRALLAHLRDRPEELRPYGS